MVDVTTTYPSERVHTTALALWGKRTLKTRVFKKVFIDFETGCWEWTAATDDKGYGQVRVGGRPIKAHIVMFTVYGGVIPDGLTLDHLCRNTLCTNPEHLEPTTRAENTLRQLAAIGHHNALKTHCVNGHEFIPDNIKPGKKPDHRICRTCHIYRNRAYRARLGSVAA